EGANINPNLFYLDLIYVGIQFGAKSMENLKMVSLIVFTIYVSGVLSDGVPIVPPIEFFQYRLMLGMLPLGGDNRQDPKKEQTKVPNIMMVIGGSGTGGPEVVGPL
ncbi:hypothetical protein ACJX0J_017361, partial [Zea mays]